MTRQDLLNKINPFDNIIAREFDKVVTAELVAKIRTVMTVGLAEVPALDDLLNYRPITLMVGSVAVPIQLKRQ